MRFLLDSPAGADGLCPDCGGPAVFSWEGIGYCKAHYTERRVHIPNIQQLGPATYKALRDPRHEATTSKPRSWHIK